MAVQIVLDTNVLVAALRSRRGASFKLLSLLGASKAFEINVSVSLVLEYEDVLCRQAHHTRLARRDIDDVIDYICAVANRRQVFFLWRPYLKDPKDDMVLELAVEGQCRYIVSFNKKDFVGSTDFGIEVLSPHEFLEKIGESQ